MPGELIWHICPRGAWRAARAAGRYDGPEDSPDPFIHFSTAAQIVESAARHHAGREGLVLLGVDPAALGTRLRWEPSRGGALFPHLYGSLPPMAVVVRHDLPLGPDGRHVFPEEL